MMGAATERARLPRFSLVLGIESCCEVDDLSCLGTLENSPVHLFQNTLRPQKNCNRIVLNGFVFSNYLKTTYTKSAKIESAIAA